MPFFGKRELLLKSRKPDPNAYQLDTPSYISFSGGRTSGYLLFHILQHYNFKLRKGIHVVFANTGREYEETLEFVQACEDNWGVKIHWVEYRRVKGAPIFTPGTEHYATPGIGCQGTIEVDFKTASRKGEPFEIMIDVEGEYKIAKGELPVLPNVAQRWCSARLKAETMDRWMLQQGYDCFNCVVGLRADEPGRVRKLKNLTSQIKDFQCPLDAAVVTVEEILAFWEKQPFDLQLVNDPLLGTFQGNCDLCFLKRTKKIERIVKEEPERLEWWARMERETGCEFSRSRMPYKEMEDKLKRNIELKMCSVDDEDVDSCACTD